MFGELLKDHLTRSLGAAFVSEEQVEAMIRPALERFGLEPAEIDEVVSEARANVRAWKTGVTLDVPALFSSGTAGLMHALGVPTRGEIEDLKRRVDALADRLPSERPPSGGERAPRPRKPAAPRSSRPPRP